MPEHQKKVHRPDRTTMEGMIWNANNVLDAALNPNLSSGIPADLFSKCKGIVLLSIVTAGFIFSGHAGSGVIMVKKISLDDDDGDHPVVRWSAPSALGVIGYGFGALAGGEAQDVIVFIMDDETLMDFVNKEQTRMAAKCSYAVGKMGRDEKIGDEAPHKGTVSVYMSKKGVFANLSIEIGTLGHRKAADHTFYGKKVSPRQILMEDAAVDIPPESGIPDLHEKLALLAEGKTKIPSMEDVDKSERLRQEAIEAGEKAKQSDPDIEYVDHSNKGTATTTTAGA